MEIKNEEDIRKNLFEDFGIRDFNHVIPRGSAS
jgi:hypothetical protein